MLFYFFLTLLLCTVCNAALSDSFYDIPLSERSSWVLVGESGSCESASDFEYCTKPSTSTLQSLRDHPDNKEAFPCKSAVGIRGLFSGFLCGRTSRGQVFYTNIQKARKKSEKELRAVMANIRNELFVMARARAIPTLAHFFFTGKGHPFSVRSNDPLYKAALEDDNLKEAMRVNKRKIDTQIMHFRTTGTIDPSKFTIRPAKPTFPFPKASQIASPRTFSNASLLKAIIGGTQGVRLYVKNFKQIDANNYSYDMRLWFCDDFGVSFDDAYTESLAAFYVLSRYHCDSSTKRNHPYMEELAFTQTYSSQL